MDTVIITYTSACFECHTGLTSIKPSLQTMSCRNELVGMRGLAGIMLRRRSCAKTRKLRRTRATVATTIRREATRSEPWLAKS